jgi:DNA topoisomerase-1
MSRHTVNSIETKRLYDLIWKERASQMSDAELERYRCKMKQSRRNIFCIGSSASFEGFLKVYLEGHDDDEENKKGCCLP